MSAVFADRAERCQGCGVYKDETSDHGMPIRPPLWAATTYMCFVCKDADQTAAGIPEKNRPGVTVHIIKHEDDDDTGGFN